tara:strand:+ start:66 stop:410 length:345 start_codon:yes stop_codon:yes gene_type:complete
MPLLTPRLERDLKKDQDDTKSLTDRGAFDSSTQVYADLGKRWAKSIEKYIQDADVVGTHMITNLMIEPGAKTLEVSPTGAPVNGETVTQGIPQAGSNKGPFGKDAYPGASGKII